MPTFAYKFPLELIWPEAVICPKSLNVPIFPNIVPLQLIWPEAVTCCVLSVDGQPKFI